MSALTFHSGTTWLEIKEFWYNIYAKLTSKIINNLLLITTTIDIRVMTTVMLLLALIFAAFGGILLHTQAQVRSDHTQADTFTLQGNISYRHRYEHNIIIVIKFLVTYSELSCSILYDLLGILHRAIRSSKSRTNLLNSV